MTYRLKLCHTSWPCFLPLPLQSVLRNFSFLTLVLCACTRRVSNFNYLVLLKPLLRFLRCSLRNLSKIISYVFSVVCKLIRRRHEFFILFLPLRNRTSCYLVIVDRTPRLSHAQLLDRSSQSWVKKGLILAFSKPIPPNPPPLRGR